MELTRRTLVAGAAAFAVLAPTIALGAGTLWAFPATSGRRLSGLLTSADPARHEAELDVLRRRAGYFRPLAYASTDRNKAAFAAALIDYRASSGIGFVVGERDALPLPAGVVTAEPGRFPNLEQMAAFLTGCAYGASAGTAHPLKRVLSERYRATAV